MAEIMTLKDLADYLRMNERTVAKLVQEGKVPGFKVASQWRFSREVIDSWFVGQMQRGSGTEELVRPQIAALLAPGAIKLDLRSRTKDGVLVEMTDLMVDSGRISSGSTLLSALRERERLCSTGIGRGIAFLHPRHVIPDIASEPVVAFGRSAEGVEFEAVDGEPVRLFFLDCAPSERVHLAILARLSRLLSDHALIEKMLAAGTAEEVIAAVSRTEEKLV